MSWNLWPVLPPSDVDVIARNGTVDANAATQVAQNRQQTAPDETPSIISVEVIGYGGDSSDDDEEKKRKRREQPQQSI